MRPALLLLAIACLALASCGKNKPKDPDSPASTGTNSSLTPNGVPQPPPAAAMSDETAKAKTAQLLVLVKDTSKEDHSVKVLNLTKELTDAKQAGPAVKEMIGLLKDPSQVVQRRAMAGLAYCHSSATPAVEPVAAFLKSPEPSLRESALSALGMIGARDNPEAKTIAKIVAGHLPLAKERREKIFALNALMYIGPPASEHAAAVEAIGAADADPTVKSAAKNALLAMKR